MEWCKLYSTFATDPKVRRLSDRAFRRYVEAMCDTALHETDGEYLFPRDRVTAELLAAGLLDDGVPSIRIHGWMTRQRSKADVDAKRIAGRNAARIRWSNTEPNTEVEVEVEGDVETAKQNPAARSSNNPHQPTDREMYFGERLGIKPSGIVKLNKEFGKANVLSAMEQVYGFPPDEGIENAFAYVRTVASFKKAGAA